MLSPHRILSTEEIRRVVDVVKREISSAERRGYAYKANTLSRRLIIFRLSACCGLRAQEIGGINVEDVSIYGDKPVIAIRKSVTKGKTRARFVPLWWSWSTLGDLAMWKQFRLGQIGDKAGEPFIPSMVGGRLPTMAAWRVWKKALAAALGKERSKQVRLHDGRHSYASHALQAGHSLVAVRDALGHASISTTSIYLHAIDRPDVPDLF